MTEEEIESVNNRKPCSGSKLREIAGSGIFAMENENDLFDLSTSSTNLNNRAGLRIYQKAISGISQISFTAEESVSPKKPTSLPEIAKQRELSGNLDSESEAKAKKLLSNAKYKELSGNDIFGPPPENPPRVLAARNLDLKGHLDFGEPASWNINTSIAASNLAGAQSAVMLTEQSALKTSKMIPNQKFQELTGNDIFKDDDASPPFAEKQLSSAKLKEISGSDIFADGKSSSRDYYGGVRKPPGGESSIALV
ncbi:hypothetical protein AXF42_Ash019280 [Apostasia shenzhenica]|uniref:DUF4057 domain-containing protein n=1 Tax=Apostasia shenzhenica TaxID=1088818 RepID=A0A2I0AR77_9ASPA|nr:hypothetical protein AXF42_Ash019280 [Apostasia shenzhenica]